MSDAIYWMVLAMFSIYAIMAFHEHILPDILAAPFGSLLGTLSQVIVFAGSSWCILKATIEIAKVVSEAIK